MSQFTNACATATPVELCESIWNRLLIDGDCADVVYGERMDFASQSAKPGTTVVRGHIASYIGDGVANSDQLPILPLFRISPIDSADLLSLMPSIIDGVFCIVPARSSDSEVALQIKEVLRSVLSRGEDDSEIEYSRLLRTLRSVSPWIMVLE